MDKNDYPVITVSGAEWQAAQDAVKLAQCSLQQLKADIAALQSKLMYAWTSCNYNEFRRLLEVLQKLSAA